MSNELTPEFLDGNENGVIGIRYGEQLFPLTLDLRAARRAEELTRKPFPDVLLGLSMAEFSSMTAIVQASLPYVEHIDKATRMVTRTQVTLPFDLESLPVKVHRRINPMLTALLKRDWREEISDVDEALEGLDPNEETATPDGVGVASNASPTDTSESAAETPSMP